MADRVLIVSGSEDWRSVVYLHLSNPPQIETNGVSYGPWFMDMVRAFKPTTVVMHGDNPAADVLAEARPAVVAQASRSLWAYNPKLAFIIVSAIPNEALIDLVRSPAPCEFVLDPNGEPGSFTDQIRATMDRFRLANAPPAPASSAIIEVALYSANIQCTVRVGPIRKQFDYPSWDRRDLDEINIAFHHYEADDERFKQVVDPFFLEGISRRILRSAFEKPLEDAQEFCRPFLAKDAKVYYRFSVRDGDLEFVPLELVATKNNGEFLRGQFPVARRLEVAQEHADPDHRFDRGRDGPLRVLFILSDVEGSLALPSHKFKGEKAVYLKRLEHIAGEMEETVTIYGQENVTPVILSHGKDPFVALSQALDDQLYDVIHFAGHSIRSDTTTKVFLAVPGKKQGVVQAYDSEDFARQAARAQARLVVLSSCEGASCRALARLAASGIPAVAGFRWKIDDGDAAKFTPALHKALRRGTTSVPVVQAFQRALETVKDSSGQRLSWFSPVLVLQPAAWPDYAVEV